MINRGSTVIGIMLIWSYPADNDSKTFYDKHKRFNWDLKIILTLWSNHSVRCILSLKWTRTVNEVEIHGLLATDHCCHDKTLKQSTLWLIFPDSDELTGSSCRLNLEKKDCKEPLNVNNLKVEVVLIVHKSINSYDHNQCHCNCNVIWSDNTELQWCMGVANNYTCYRQLFLCFLHLFSNFTHATCLYVPFTPFQLCTF